jgi:hypothetical protein
MDFTAGRIGIRVSEDRKICWVIVREDSGWKVFGEAFQLREVPRASDSRIAGHESVLTLACKLLEIENPALTQLLRDLGSRSDS